MKRITSLLLALAMIFCVGIYFPEEALAADVAWNYGGAGTSTSPYIIDTAAEFTAFMANVTGGSTYSGKYFRVDADIAYNQGYTLTFDEASGLVKVANSSGTVLFALGTGIPGTTYHKGYVNMTTWDNVGVPGVIYSTSSLTGALTEATVTMPLTAWAYANKSASFAGTLDFNGHSLSGIYINTTANSVGVFGSLAKTCTVMGLTLKNSYVRGNGNTGAIVGIVSANAKIYNCVNEAVVCGIGSAIGGIVGQSIQEADPFIVGCENKGYVGTLYNQNSSNSNAFAGGIVGQTRGATFVACKNSGVVFAGGGYACGGIVGLLDTGGQNNKIIGSTYVYACVNTGVVKSSFNKNAFDKIESVQVNVSSAPVGAIVGFLDPYWSNKGTEINVKYCVNLGDANYGTLIGKSNSVHSENSYNGPCSATVRVTDTVSVDDSYLASPLTALSIGGSYVYVTLENNKLIKSDALDKSSILVDLADKANDFVAKLPNYSYIWYNGSDFDVIGYGNNLYDEYGFVDFKQDGSKENPVIIDSAQDLKDLRDAVNGGKSYDGVHFAITADIDLSGEASWTPIGYSAYSVSPSVYFGGKLYGAKADGTPAVISGLKITSTDTSTKQNAFIGINKGEVSNITFKNATVNAKRYAAVVVGENIGTIKNCTTEGGSVTLKAHTAASDIGNEGASAPAGGICAVNFGTIESCKNGASVSSDYTSVGGIAGSNLARISYCTNYGNVSGVATTGGIAGYLGASGKTYGEIKYCGNLADVTVTASHVAGIVGWARDSAGISYSYNGGTIRSTNEKTDLGSYSVACVSGILGCGNLNDLNSGNSYVVANCYNAGDIYAGDTKKTSNDVGGWIGGYGTTRLLKATTGKSDATNGIYDGLYAKINGISYASVPNLEHAASTSYNPNKEFALTGVSFTGGAFKLTFSEPVKSVGGTYKAIRFCKVSENGVPNLAWADVNGDGAAEPLQIDLGATFDNTNVAMFTLPEGYDTTGTIAEVIAKAAEKRGFTDYITDCVPLICIEGLPITTEGYTNLSGVIDGIASVENPLSFGGNYGIYSQYAAGTITKADAQSGALCDFLNEKYQTNIYTQNIGVDPCPVIKGEIGSIKLIKNIDGTYTVPELVGSVANAGSLVGYRDQTGKVHGAGEKIAYAYVSPVYESALVLKYGAAVKVGSGDVTGLRWTAKINKKALSGYTIVEKGFIIAPTAYVTGEWAVVNGKNVKAKKVAQDFTQEAFDSVGIDYIKVTVGGFNDLAGTEFAASVSNLYKENFSLGYSARAYLDVKDASGNVKRIYSGFEGANGEVYFSYAEAASANSRAPGEIAKKALADLSATASKTHGYKIITATDAFLTENGYGSSYYYSPYSAKAREHLYEFILTLPEKAEDEKIFYPKYNNVEEYAPMRAELRKWIMNQLESGDGAIFSAELLNVNDKASGIAGILGQYVSLGGNNIRNGGTISFATLSSRWQKSAISSVMDDGDEHLTVTYTDSVSGLKFTTTVILYGDTPTADIKTVVQNISSARSPVLKSFYAIDASYNLAKAGGDIKLTTLVGSYAASRDFDMVERNLTTEFVQPTLNGTVVTNQHSVFYPTGSKGFSSSNDGFPYFDLLGDGKGLLMAIGWSGQWEASFKKDTSGNAIMKARQQYLSTYLEPGEQIEAPRIVLSYFEGDYEYGHNMWREMMLSHYTPDNDNDPDNEPNFVAPIPANFWGGTYHETVKISVEKYVQKGAAIDIVWFDAGWYGPLLNEVNTSAWNAEMDPDVVYDEKIGSWNTYVAKNPKTTYNWTGWIQFRGDYIENKYLFPNGLEEIGKFVDDTNAKYGTNLKFMLWYMIHDRHSTHPEYTSPSGNVVVSAGNTEIRILTEEEVAQYKGKYPGLADLDSSDYLVGGNKLDLSSETTLNKIIAYYKYMKDVKGVDAIRLDNSWGPLDPWLQKDVATQKANTSITPSSTTATNNYRMGYTENKWTTNEYILWDTLKAHSSEFFLDNTASGGRRLDIELVSRSMSLWRTDWNNGGDFFNEAHQKMTQTLSLWIPLSTVGVAGTDDYAARSYYSASVCVSGQGSWDTSTEKDENGNYKRSGGAEKNSNEIVDRTHEIAELRPYWYGNYYQLLPVTTDYTSWQAYELYREDWDEGMFVVVCRPQVTQTEDPTGKTLTKTIKLKGLDSCATYLIHNIDDVNGDKDIYASGAKLMNEGITVTGKTRTINTYKIILAD